MRTAPIRILLVEDNPADVRLVHEMLASQPGAHDIAVAENGLEAEARITTFDPHVILLDLGLPDGQALETLLRIHSAAPALPIVVISGNNDESLALQALQLGAQDFLVKWETSGYLLARALSYAMERKQLQDRLFHLAHHDPLTGLANRKYFYERLRQCLSLCNRHGTVAAFFYIDLDGFKGINDLYGHAAGDEILRMVGRRLNRCVRLTDCLGRLGGDEFALVVADLADPAAAAAVAEKLRAAFASPVVWGEHTIPIHASIGASLYPQDGEELEALVRKADSAMYQAKSAEQGSAFRFFVSTLHHDTLDRKTLEAQLRQALSSGEFRIHYQPQIGLRSGRVVGMEALLRWERPSGECTYPSEFLTLLEETGLIVDVGEWVLREACRQGREWADAGVAPLTVSVNLAAPQLHVRDFAETVARILTETGLPPEHLALEFRESTLAALDGTGDETLQALHRLGVQLTLDNFWSGPASLRYLTELPIRNIKLDRSLIQEVVPGTGLSTILKAVTDVAHLLRIRETITGIENIEQLDFFRAAHCEGAQGYAIARPMAPEECLAYLRQAVPIASTPQ
jgi:diguanylate cyclase (GGDEF)-like protein